ncbi:hypothetical protein [Sphingobacterium faecale]|uniref:Uncharacterized protein n=1 Tax=Sphingobacterium faecale TaxID=2803775 RepID=A0ABS1R1N4_9SPHI|nr:hypothetical protein [Sphingobacterium faecale]MBL1408220.1 hypothetical protein [Sphingobacterium faecale]
MLYIRESYGGLSVPYRIMMIENEKGQRGIIAYLCPGDIEGKGTVGEWMVHQETYRQ